MPMTSCRAEEVEDEFFRGDIATRSQRLADYPMEQQWRIFLYGNQERHPPATGLAAVLARGGEPMLRFILKELESTKRDLDYRDSMVVFQSMQWHGDFAICADRETIARIRGNQEKIVHSEWRRIYAEMFRELCDSR